MKIKFVVRVHITMDDYLRNCTNALGIRLGTYLSAIMDEELKASIGNSQYAFVEDFEYFLPRRNAHQKSAGKQISLYLTKEAASQIEKLKQVTGYIATSQIILGVLLNTEIGKAYYRQQKAVITKSNKEAK